MNHRPVNQNILGELQRFLSLGMISSHSLCSLYVKHADDNYQVAQWIDNTNPLEKRTHYSIQFIQFIQFIQWLVYPPFGTRLNRCLIDNSLLCPASGKQMSWFSKILYTTESLWKVY